VLHLISRFGPAANHDVKRVGPFSAGTDFDRQIHRIPSIFALSWCIVTGTLKISLPRVHMENPAGQKGAFPVWF
jgi:hypothetical protein